MARRLINGFRAAVVPSMQPRVQPGRAKRTRFEQAHERGVGFAGAACAAEAELGGAVGVVAGAGGGVEAQLLGEGYVGEVMEADELVFGTAGGACLAIEAGQVVRIGVIHRGKLPQGVFVFLHLALR